MSNRAWVRRRTKRGLAARQYAAIERQMRRARNQPLPQTFRSRGSGMVLTVTLGVAEPREEEIWMDEEHPEGCDCDELLDDPEHGGRVVCGLCGARYAAKGFTACGECA